MAKVGDRICGRDLKVGDVLNNGKDDKTITHFKEHRGLDGFTARIACSGQWSITIFDDNDFRFTSDGTWIDGHVWWSYEQRKRLPDSNGQLQLF